MFYSETCVVGINGWFPTRLAKDIIHNRTVNIVGGSGRNLEMDLVNEFLNNKFKGIIQDLWLLIYKN